MSVCSYSAFPVLQSELLELLEGSNPTAPGAASRHSSPASPTAIFRRSKQVSCSRRMNDSPQFTQHMNAHQLTCGHVVVFLSGDQVCSKDGQDPLVDASDVVQVSAPPLLRPLVHLPAWLCPHVSLQSASAAHGVRRAEEDAGQEASGSR